MVIVVGVVDVVEMVDPVVVVADVTGNVAGAVILLLILEGCSTLLETDVIGTLSLSFFSLSARSFSFVSFRICCSL